MVKFVKLKLGNGLYIALRKSDVVAIYEDFDSKENKELFIEVAGGKDPFVLTNSNYSIDDLIKLFE